MKLKNNKKFKALLLMLVFSSITSVTLAEQKAVYTIEDAAVVASRVTYDYNEGSLYQVNTQLQYVTDIALNLNENLTYIVGGDTERWAIDKAKVGNVMHVYIKPKVANISTNIIINTDKHCYRLLVYSTDHYNPLVMWNFPEEMYQKMNKTTVYQDKEQKDFLDIFTEQKDGHYISKKMNYAYVIQKDKKMGADLCPVKVFDDGVRTYIQMPKSNKYDLPVLYYVEDNNKEKLVLVNYRVHGEYFIADRVFDHARLCYSSNLSVDIFPRNQGGEGK